ncbi:MAG: DUF2723 domain-containing protein [Brevibacillus sp.]|nr:DUF2723 domain-containing protein [Brevibacillus sp.]
MQGISQQKNLIALTGLVGLALVVRLVHAGTYAESWDAVDFALALERYDIFEMQPHFPGYPLFILFGHLFLPLTGDPVLALSWLSAWFGSLSIIPFYQLACRTCRDPLTVWTACLLFAANPLLALTGTQPMSEALGMFFVLVFQAWVARTLDAPPHRLLFFTCVGVILLSCILAVRISYFPVGLVLLYPLTRLWKAHKRTTGSLLACLIVILVFTASLLAWLLPTAATEGGLTAYFALGKAFTSGHFAEWGGTAFTAESDAAWWERIKTWIWDRAVMNGLTGTAEWATMAPLSVGVAIFCTSLSVFLLVAGALQLIHRGTAKRSVASFAALSVIPYALWMIVGQNPEKSRHLLPLLPWVILLAAYGWTVLWKLSETRSAAAVNRLVPCPQSANSGFGRTCFAPNGRAITHCVLTLPMILLICSLFVRQLTVLEQHLHPPPALQLVRYVEEHYPAEKTLIYTWEEQRLFDYYAPAIGTERLQSFPYFVQSLLLQAETKPYMLITKAVLDGFGAEHPFRSEVKEVARFTADPFLFPVYDTVVVYEIPVHTVNLVKRGALQ